MVDNEDDVPVRSLAEHLQMLTDSNLLFRSENRRLKWIIGQLLRRMKKDNVILYMVGQPTAIHIEENPTRKLIHVRIKDYETTPDSGGESSLT